MNRIEENNAPVNEPVDVVTKGQVRAGQFTVRFQDGTVLDLTPHLPCRDGVFENPSRHTRRIIERMLPEKIAEYDAYSQRRELQLQRLDHLINRAAT